MTKKRDRYLSGFDAGVPGIRAAVYDIGLALYILEEIAKKHELLRERMTFHNGQGWTFAQALEIAREALNQSVSPVSWIYERLQQNEEAARVMAEAHRPLHSLALAKWEPVSEALTDTLNNKAVVSRGFVSEARRTIARREAQKQSSEKEPYIDDWCADSTLSHELCSNGACECPCHAAKALVMP